MRFGKETKPLLRVGALAEYLKGSLWLLPAVLVAAAMALGTVLSTWPDAAGAAFEPWAYGGSPAGAREILSTLAGAMITVTALTFSLTVIALQMASAQFSPRVLRGFLTDRGNQFVLGVLLAAFTYAIAVLRAIREEETDAGAAVPGLAVTVGMVLSAVAVGALVYFIHHLARQLQAQTILREIAEDAVRLVDAVHPDPLESETRASSDPATADPPPPMRAIAAKRSGYLQAIDARGLVKAAAAAEVGVRLRPAVGSYVARGSTLAWLWADGGSISDDDPGLDRVAHDHVHIGVERTLQQDVAFALRQLVDIGVKALSTGMNDPTTAVDALGHLSAVMCTVATRRTGTLIASDGGGRARAVIPRPGFRDYLHLCCDQIRRYGASEPAVLRAVLGLLSDTAEVVITDGQRAAIDDEAARTAEIARRSLDATDCALIESSAALTRQALTAGRRPGPRVFAD